MTYRQVRTSENDGWTFQAFCPRCTADRPAHIPPSRPLVAGGEVLECRCGEQAETPPEALLSCPLIVRPASDNHERRFTNLQTVLDWYGPHVWLMRDSESGRYLLRFVTAGLYDESLAEVWLADEPEAGAVQLTPVCQCTDPECGACGGRCNANAATKLGPRFDRALCLECAEQVTDAERVQP